MAICQEYYSKKSYTANMINKIEVGKRLKEARKNAGYTQKQVAEKMGTVQTAYIKYENGRLELDYQKIYFLCKLFDISADYLLGLEDESGRKIYKINNNIHHNRVVNINQK